MKGKIGLEEHFAIQDTLDDSKGHLYNWKTLERNLLDIQKIRLEQMDEYGIECMVLSLNSPAIQTIHNRRQAIDTARKANDILAEEIAKNPKRFAGFAALPMQEPDEAIKEMHRCIKDYGFKGVLVNSFSQIDVEDSCFYYDLPQYFPFWGEVEKLDIPFYLHPRMPAKSNLFEGHPWLAGSVWGFTVDTSTHVLRLMSGGVFDAYPKLKIILGHLGETLPASIWRISNRMQLTPHDGAKFKRPFAEYMQENFYVTTSGNFRLPPLLACIMELGSDKIMFSTDYPFEQISEAATWFDEIEIGDYEKEKIGRLNAKELFKLDFLD